MRSLQTGRNVHGDRARRSRRGRDGREKSDPFESWFVLKFIVQFFIMQCFHRKSYHEIVSFFRKLS